MKQFTLSQQYTQAVVAPDVRTRFPSNQAQRWQLGEGNR